MGRKLTSCIKMKYQNNNNEKFFHHTVLTPFVLINPFVYSQLSDAKSFL